MWDTEKFKGWEDVDWIDMEPGGGSFLSTKDAMIYEVHGESIRAFNWMHAHYLWVSRQVDASGEEWQRCVHCNHYIRYGVVFRDPDGKYHLVGENCADFISSRKSRKDYSEFRTLAKVEEINTKHGLRYALSMDLPKWYWDIPREARPSFASAKKSTSARTAEKWYLTVWGADRGEVYLNWETLKKLGGQK